MRLYEQEELTATGGPGSSVSTLSLCRAQSAQQNSSLSRSGLGTVAHTDQTLELQGMSPEGDAKTSLGLLRLAFQAWMGSHCCTFWESPQHRGGRQKALSGALSKEQIGPGLPQASDLSRGARVDFSP